MREREARLAEQQKQLTAQESELAGRTAASLRARRRGAGRGMLLGTDEDQSTLG
jgi:ribosome-interacting GTPase 1